MPFESDGEHDRAVACCGLEPPSRDGRTDRAVRLHSRFALPPKVQPLARPGFVESSLVWEKACKKPENKQYSCGYIARIGSLANFADCPIRLK